MVKSIVTSRRSSIHSSVSSLISAKSRSLLSGEGEKQPVIEGNVQIQGGYECGDKVISVLHTPDGNSISKTLKIVSNNNLLIFLSFLISRFRNKLSNRCEPSAHHHHGDDKQIQALMKVVTKVRKHRIIEKKTHLAVLQPHVFLYIFINVPIHTVKSEIKAAP